jgi:serine-type D-Ala-D-Ala carboxypeptidase (penicillin-binding protein 5/6)
LVSVTGESSASLTQSPAIETTTDGPDTPGVPAPGNERPQHARRHRNRRRIKWSIAVLAVLILLSAGWLGAQRVDQPLAQPTITSARYGSYLVRGSDPALLWPAIGQAAVAIPALDYAEQSGPEEPVPVASLTKMATAVVVLHDHPIPLNSSGPSISITAADVGQYTTDLQNDETNIPLLAGETLTELQMLEALLNQSANDVAYSLAVWDAGSEAAFVAKMNSLAVSLGALHTHYVDTSGFQPQSVSTAADSLRIAAAGMSIPTFAKVAAMPTVSLPLVGTVHNIVTQVGSNGVVGVKSGYTGQSAGCMVLAGYRTIFGRSVLVLASALGQHVQTSAPAPPAPPAATAPTAPTPAAATPAAPAAAVSGSSTGATTSNTMPIAPYNALEAQYPLLYTGPLVEHLLDVTEAAVVPVIVTQAGEQVGMATANWGGVRHDVPAIATRPAMVLGIPGQRVVVETRPTPAVASGTTHSQAGAVLFRLGTQTAMVPLKRLHAVPEPTWSWRMLHD